MKVLVEFCKSFTRKGRVVYANIYFALVEVAEPRQWIALIFPCFIKQDTSRFPMRHLEIATMTFTQKFDEKIYDVFALCWHFRHRHHFISSTGEVLTAVRRKLCHGGSILMVLAQLTQVHAL